MNRKFLAISKLGFRIGVDKPLSRCPTEISMRKPLSASQSDVTPTSASFLDGPPKDDRKSGENSQEKIMDGDNRENPLSGLIVAKGIEPLSPP